MRETEMNDKRRTQALPATRHADLVYFWDAPDDHDERDFSEPIIGWLIDWDSNDGMPFAQPIVIDGPIDNRAYCVAYTTMAGKVWYQFLSDRGFLTWEEARDYGREAQRKLSAAREERRQRNVAKNVNEAPTAAR
jgi:hypothetical protein